jgi:hypothetical protein
MMVIIIEELVHGLDPLHELLRVDCHHLTLDMLLGLLGIHSVHVLEDVLQVQNEQVLILGYRFRVLVLEDKFPEALAMIQNLKG